MTPSALRSLWKHPWGVREILYYLNARCREEITCEEGFPPTEPVFSHLYPGLHRRKQSLIFSAGQVTANVLSGAQYRGTDHGVFQSLQRVLLCRARIWAQPWAQGTAHLSPGCCCSCPSPWGAGREQGIPMVHLSLLNHLLLSPTAAPRCCCQADLPNVLLTGLYSNESKTGSSFQGCLYAKEGVKA